MLPENSTVHDSDDETAFLIGSDLFYRENRRHSYNLGSNDSLRKRHESFCVDDRRSSNEEKHSKKHCSESDNDSAYSEEMNLKYQHIYAHSASGCNSETCNGDDAYDHQRNSEKYSNLISYKIINFMPAWIASFMTEPEYVMRKSKSADQSLVHRHADSLFSTESGFTNYRGLLNLCLILLVLSNARLFLENIINDLQFVPCIMVVHPLFSTANWKLIAGSNTRKKYIIAQMKIWNSDRSFGISSVIPKSACQLAQSVLIISVTFSILYAPPVRWPQYEQYGISNVFILASFYTECFLSKGIISEKLGLVLYTINLTLLLVSPAAVILYIHPNPVFSVVTLGTYTLIFLKLVSYASVNKWCRQQRAEKKKIKRTKSVSMSEKGASTVANGREETIWVNYPDNLNYSDLYYFMGAPTLCYELNFPRSQRIRKRFLLKRVLEMLFLSSLMMGLIQQWIIPTVRNSMKPLVEMEFGRVVERLLKLAIPNHFIWLMFFYWFFHSTLNVIAELLRFGDREFYKDWWNSETVNQFWQNWNVPVHRWASRHLYKPLMRRGYGKLHASVAVFFLSAFFHEYLVSVPLQMFRVWAFIAMLGQVPLALIQTKYIPWKYGNIVVWLSLIVGQPIAIFAYFHDYYVMHAFTSNATAAV